MSNCTPLCRRIAFLILIVCTRIFGGSLVVAVKDPGAILVPGAAVEVTVAGEADPRVKTTDPSGRAVFDSIPAGASRVAVNKDGFEPWQGSVTVGNRPANLAVALKLPVLTSSVHVTARRSALANSDPNYQTLRHGKLGRVYRVSNLAMSRDAGTFTFRSGSFSFLPPVLGHVTTGVFVGEGNFRLTPEGDLAAVRLKRMMGSESVDEDFTAMVVFCSDSTFDEVVRNSEPVDEPVELHEEALKRIRNVIEGRREPRDPHSLAPRSALELMLNFEDIPNYDAEILAEIYNGDFGERRGSFRAFIHGQKHADLRFLLNPHGAMPMMRAPEEVAVINFNPISNSDGVWYLSHTVAELRAGLANSKEEKRLLASDHYMIDAVLGQASPFSTQPDLTVTCDLKFHALEDGIRMVKFDLMPDLQVARVTWNGNELPFVQESRNHDGSFYLQMPEVLMKGRGYEASFEYAGGEIVQTRFGFLGLPPRRIWYPTPSGPDSRATYDLTFHIPQGSKIATVGHQVRQGRDGFWDTSQWTTEVPITQAVFRWVRDATVKTEIEETTKSRMLLYNAAEAGPFGAPSNDYMLGDIGNALRLFNTWFGKSAYDNLTVLVGGNGASLPGLVYVPWIFMGGSGLLASRISLASPVRARVDEVFPGLIAGQWWKNSVTPASLHDEWLTEGLSGFSASVYDLARDNDAYTARWVAAREAILQGVRASTSRPNDAGPVWMGMLNNTPVTPGAGWLLNSNKGAYIVQMLRGMMWDPKAGDHAFQVMMQDFVATFMNQPVSSEDFQLVVEKHMTAAMDLAGDRRMNWFFSEWLRETDIPSYRLEYSLKPGANGDTMMEGKLTQSGVSPSFRMLVPVFAEFGGKRYRLSVVPLRGNSTGEFTASMSFRPAQILLNANHDLLSDKDEVIPAKVPLH